MQVETVKNCDRSFPRADGNAIGCCDGDLSDSNYQKKRRQTIFGLPQSFNVPDTVRSISEIPSLSYSAFWLLPMREGIHL